MHVGLTEAGEDEQHVSLHLRQGAPPTPRLQQVLQQVCVEDGSVLVYVGVAY